MTRLNRITSGWLWKQFLLTGGMEASPHVALAFTKIHTTDINN